MGQQTLEEGFDLLLNAAGRGGRVGLRLDGDLRLNGLGRLLLLGLRAGGALRTLGTLLGAALLLGLLGTLFLLGLLNLLARAGDDARRRLGTLLRLRAGSGGQRGFGRGRLIGRLIGHLDLRRRSTDAQKAGTGVLQDLDAHAVAVHPKLRQRGFNGKLNGLAGGNN